MITSSLQYAHARLSDFLGEGFEPLSGWERVDEHHTFLRPEKTRLLLLSESPLLIAGHVSDNFEAAFATPSDTC